MYEKEVAWILLEKKAVLLQPNEPFTYASGIKSPIYCDNRLLISYPKEREQIVDYFVKIIKDQNLDADIIAGTATAGIPWASFISQKLGKPMIYVKKAAKEHGTKKNIEGSLEKGQKVLVVEDLISTGKSSLEAVKSIRDAGGVVYNCLAIFTYGMKKAEESFQNEKCNTITLSNFSTLVDVAVKNNYMKEEEKDIVLNWSQDPESWGK